VLIFCFTQKITWEWLVMNHDLPNFAAKNLVILML
jgi:hypothetical protein